jgi:two-component system alkaline phosphatase synthesis response regulator PhoP
LLRRTDSPVEDVNKLQLGEELVIDKSSYKVYLKGVNIDLPRKEFELLFFLASKPGKVFKREEIYRQVWGPDVIVGNRTIDVHIRKIREKIGNDYIKTIKGIGYRFDF